MAKEWGDLLGRAAEELDGLAHDEAAVRRQGQGNVVCRRPDYLKDKVFSGLYDANQRFRVAGATSKLVVAIPPLRLDLPDDQHARTLTIPRKKGLIAMHPNDKLVLLIGVVILIAVLARRRFRPSTTAFGHGLLGVGGRA